MKFKKRGVGAMICGVFLIFLMFYPTVVVKHPAGITLFVVGWIMFAVGAVQRGNQKREQQKVERAMYDWADERLQQGATPPYFATQGDRRGTRAVTPPQGQNGAQRAEIDALARENAELRRRLDVLEKSAAPADGKRACPVCGAIGQGNYCESCGAPLK